MDLDVRSARRVLLNTKSFMSSQYTFTPTGKNQISQANIVGFIRPCTYINNTLISTMHLYPQPISQANVVGFIRPSTITHALI